MLPVFAGGGVCLVVLVCGCIADSIVLSGVSLNKFGSWMIASFRVVALVVLYSFPSGVVSAL